MNEPLTLQDLQSKAAQEANELRASKLYLALGISAEALSHLSDDDLYRQLNTTWPNWANIPEDLNAQINLATIRFRATWEKANPRKTPGCNHVGAQGRCVLDLGHDPPHKWERQTQEREGITCTV